MPEMPRCSDSRLSHATQKKRKYIGLAPAAAGIPFRSALKWTETWRKGTMRVRVDEERAAETAVDDQLVVDTRAEGAKRIIETIYLDE